MTAFAHLVQAWAAILLTFARGAGDAGVLAPGTDRFEPCSVAREKRDVGPVGAGVERSQTLDFGHDDRCLPYRQGRRLCRGRARSCCRHAASAAGKAESARPRGSFHAARFAGDGKLKADPLPDAARPTRRFGARLRAALKRFPGGGRSSKS